MTAPPKEMHTFQARLATFQTPHQLTKRRASAQSKKKGSNTVEWPHEKPTAVDLARAGFFFRPAHDSTDNVQCFLCTVKLDGWEPTDDPIQEHLAHSRNCAWAKTINVWREEDDKREAEMRDPLSDELVGAREATFRTGDGWPHEEKKGWKPKIAKMLDAGWAWDPAGEGEDGDGVTCFYCSLSLDGWEPKDDPFVEHKRRSPACRFFELLEHYHGVDAANGKMKKAKVQGMAGSRTSTASKASRMSTQSAMSEGISIPGSYGDALEDGTLAGVDDSIVTTATNASQATTTSTTKGKKKAGRPKAPAKGTKGKKKAQLEAQVEHESAAQDPTQLSGEAPVKDQYQPAPSRASTKCARESKQIDSSVIEISQIETAPPKKGTRGRKPKAPPQPEPEPLLNPETPDAAVIAQKRLSEVSAQLQDELEHSIENLEPLDESTPAAQPPQPKRGVKRTSDGFRKEPEIESSIVQAEAPAPAKAKGKRGRPKKVSAASTAADSEVVIPEGPLATREDPIELDTPEVQTAPAPKKGKGRSKGKKASSSRFSRSSKVNMAASDPEPVRDEDLARDEMEIELELERIAADKSSQQALQAEQDHLHEFDPSPSHGRVSKDNADMQQLQDEVEAEGEKIAEKDFASPPRKSKVPGGFIPSPSGSDKENQPSSIAQPSAKQPGRPAVVLSPSTTIRIPLAASTPNRSPGKALMSPSKQVSHLSSTVPWIGIDMDTVLLASPQPSPGKVGQQLIVAAGALTSPEKRMSVEEWVRFRAEKGEEELRRRCEVMVAAFEKQGIRGLDSLNGINVVG